MSRQYLTSDLNLYVAYDGSDSNDGLSSSTPFLTLQKAWNWSRDNLDRCGHSVIVTVKPDTGLTHTYASLSAFGIIPGGVVPEQIGSIAPGFQIIGNPSFHAQCTIHATAAGENCITAGFGAALYITGVKLISDGQSGLVSFPFGWITAGNIEFSSCAWAHKHACGSGAVISQKNTLYWISGNAAFHNLAEDDGKIWDLDNTPTLPSNRTFSGTPNSAFAHANQTGRIDYTGTTFPPFMGVQYGATGTRYVVLTAGGISGTGSATFLPGNVAGVNNGGWYE